MIFFWYLRRESLLFNGYRVSFPGGVKRPGRGVDHPPLSSAEVKEIIIIIIFIYCNWVVTRWQWLFYMYTKLEIGYY